MDSKSSTTSLSSNTSATLDLLSCDICCEKFTEVRNKPMVLPCGHTICSECLTKLKSIPSEFRCPIDLKQINSYSKNYSLLKLVQAGQKLHKTTMTEDGFIGHNQVLLLKTPTKGGRYIGNHIIAGKKDLGPEYTKDFDDMNEIPNLAKMRISKIKVWRENFWYQGDVVKGIQVTYENTETGVCYTTSRRVGKGFSNAPCEEYAFEADEHIVGVKVRSGLIVDRLVFETSKNRIIAIGGQNGSEHDYEIKNMRIVGFFGGYDKWLDNIGFYMTPYADSEVEVY